MEHFTKEEAIFLLGKKIVFTQDQRTFLEEVGPCDDFDPSNFDYRKGESALVAVINYIHQVDVIHLQLSMNNGEDYYPIFKREFEQNCRVVSDLKVISNASSS